MPALFVFLWSTGFISAKYGLPHAPPATFLLLRFVFVVALMVPLAIMVRAAWPTTLRQVLHLVVIGVLVQAGYLGGVFGAIDHGMSAGVAALIVGLQPILTAIVASPALGERVNMRQWTGLTLGLGGTALVVANKISVAGLSGFAIFLAAIALASITVGTVYQKRFAGNFDLRSGSIIQFAAAAIAIAPFALAESRSVEWTPGFIFSMTWLIVVLSIGAISLLAVLIRRGEATKLASLFYLVPPVTALIAYLAFGETLGGLALLGMVLSVIGVALVVR